MWGACGVLVLGGVVLYSVLRNNGLGASVDNLGRTCLDIFGSFFAQMVTRTPRRMSAQVWCVACVVWCIVWCSV